MTWSIDSRSTVASTRRTSMPARRSSAASSASVYGGFVVPSTSSRSWQRPSRVKATPLITGGLMRSVFRPSIMMVTGRP